MLARDAACLRWAQWYDVANSAAVGEPLAEGGGDGKCRQTRESQHWAPVAMTGTALANPTVRTAMGGCDEATVLPLTVKRPHNKRRDANICYRDADEMR